MSSRQAEFLHNEVPGIIVPEGVRNRLGHASAEEARAVGVEVAREITSEVLAQFSGVYLITPFLNFESTCELAQFARNV
jgi:homocysteine S-methyltransferase